MTLHNAKGLEYDTVFIVGCEDGAFPHMRALEEGGEEEERRLCYVGITRARRRLYMTWARERRLFGRAERNLPSRFIDELPAELTERHGGARRRGDDAGTSAGAGAGSGAPIDPGPALELQTGDDVVHASFGDGRRHRGRAGRGGRRPLRRRRRRAQADGRLRADPEAVVRWPARMIDGKAVAAAVRERVAREVAELRAGAGRAPALATVLVGDDPASEIYVRDKHKACEEVGMRSVHHGLAGDDAPGGAARAGRRARTTTSEVDGILRPAAAARRRSTPIAVVAAIDPGKDVDGLTPVNAGLLAHGTPGLVPCTPAGVMELLRHEGVELEGAEAVVVGRSKLVGVPVAAAAARRRTRR